MDGMFFGLMIERPRQTGDYNNRALRSVPSTLLPLLPQRLTPAPVVVALSDCPRSEGVLPSSACVDADNIHIIQRFLAALTDRVLVCVSSML